MQRRVKEFTGKEGYEFGDLTRTAIKRWRSRASQPEVRSVFGWTDVPANEAGSGSSSEGEIQDFEDHQSRLKRLPIPDVRHTCDIYLKSLRPLLNDEEFARSTAAVEKFLANEADELQAQMKASDAQQTAPSWLEPIWDTSYLASDSSIAIHVNYCFGFEDDPVKEKNTMVPRAASLLRGMLTFYRDMRRKKWDLDQERGRPLCMSQYIRVFGCTRVPGNNRDTLITHTTQRPAAPSMTSKTSLFVLNDPCHVVVMCKNWFFSVDVFRRDHSLVPLTDIEAALGSIVEQCAEREEQAVPIGVFTAGNRATWARQRDALIDHNPANKEVLEKIQSALLVVCLDMLSPADDDEYARLLLHGAGTNRWFDKHNLIVCSNGKAGVCFEHACGDGSTTLRVADETFKWSVANGNITPAAPGVGAGGALVQELVFAAPETVVSELRATFAVFKQEILANETKTLNFNSYGGAWIKEFCSMSPDAFVQVAIQLAYYKMFGRLVATYEAASTRCFLHGRTETVRSCTQEVLEFCQACSQPLLKEGAEARQFELLKQAVQAHVNFMRAAKVGEGCDRHLLGLRLMAEKNARQQNKESHGLEIFDDPAFKMSSKWKVSTSHCGSQSLSWFGFGPVTPEGFGIGYMIKNDCVKFNVTSKHTYQLTSSSIYCAFLEQALLHLKGIVLSNPDVRDAPSKSMQFSHPTTGDISYFNYDQELWEDVFGY